MILELAQILSTAHRVLDGTITDGLSQSGRKKKVWKLEGKWDTVYSATHINHPSTVWARKTSSNYNWLWLLLHDLCKEYTYRYGKTHKCESSGLVELLEYPPMNIPMGPFTEPTPAMPDQYKVPGDSIKSYHNYYNGEKQRMFAWKKRDVPYFILHPELSKTSPESNQLVAAA